MPRTLIGAIVASAIALTGCSGQDEAGPNPTAATSSSPEGTDQADQSSDASSESASATASPSVALGTDYPLEEGVTRDLGEPIAEKSADRDSFALSSVVRVAPDRVVVSGVLNLAEPIQLNTLMETGFDWSARGGEFSSVSVSQAGDEARYLPVRDENDDCLCSVIRGGFEETELPVSVVVSAPAEATVMEVSVEPFGTFEDVPVLNEPAPSSQRSPLGLRESIVVERAERADGVVTARVTLQNPSSQFDRLIRGAYNSPIMGAEGRVTIGSVGVCFFGMFVLSSNATAGLSPTEGECAKGLLPDAGMQTTFDVEFGDPGGDTLTFLPASGYPIQGVPIEGEPSVGASDVSEFAFRSRTAGATVGEGESVRVELSTEVLFAQNSAELTSKADKTIAVAVEALRGQEGRTITIVGHTDSRGDEDFNLKLSKDRAEAVRKTLANELGSDWSLEADGFGESQPVADEKGDAEAVEAAQDRNRRVEITVEK